MTTTLRIATLSFVTLAALTPASAFAATLNVSPSSGASGTPVTISGSGYQPGEVVRIWFGSSQQTTTSSGATYADSGGNFSIPMTVPWGVSGSTLVMAQGSSSGITGSQSFFVNGGGNTSGQGSLSLSTHDGVPGSSVVVYGSAFPSNSAIAIYFGGVVAGNTTSDSFGHFQATVVVPNLSPGLVSVTATGAIASNPPTFVIDQGGMNPPVSSTPQLTVGSIGGSSVLINGTGFMPGETVRLTWGGPTSSTVVADGSGSFSIAITKVYASPYATAQAMSISALGLSSGRSAYVLVSFPQSTSASLSVSPSSGGVNTLVTVSGSGFAANEGVTVTSQLGTRYLTADYLGNFSMTFTAPSFQTSQNISIQATGAQSGASANGSFFVTAQPVVNNSVLLAQIQALRSVIAQLTQILNNLLAQVGQQ